MNQTQPPKSQALGLDVLLAAQLDREDKPVALSTTAPRNRNEDQDPNHRRRVKFRQSLSDPLQQVPTAGLESLLSRLVGQETPAETSLLARLAQLVLRLIQRFLSLFRETVGEAQTDPQGLPTGNTRRLLAEVVLDELSERAQSSPRGQSQIEQIQQQLEQRRTDARHLLAQHGPTDPESLRILADAEARRTSGLDEARAKVEMAKAEVRSMRAQPRPRGVLSSLTGSPEKFDEQLRQAELLLQSATEELLFVHQMLGREQTSALQKITENVDRLTLAFELYSARIDVLERELKARKRMDELEAERQRRWQSWRNGSSDAARREDRDRYPRDR